VIVKVILGKPVLPSLIDTLLARTAGGAEAPSSFTMVTVATAAVGTAVAWGVVSAGFWAAGASPLVPEKHAEDVDQALLKGEYAWADLAAASGVN
jgi:hypothetical protein